MRGIYKISNNINDKVYIGKSENIFRRWTEHESMLKNNIHHSWKLQEFYNELNEDMKLDFNILENVQLGNDLSEYEYKWVEEYNAIENGYNVAIVKSVECDNVKIKPKKVKKDKIDDEERDKSTISVVYAEWHRGNRIKPTEPIIKFAIDNNISLEIYGKLDIELNDRCEEFLVFLLDNIEKLSSLNNFLGVTIFKTNCIWEMYIGILVDFTNDDMCINYRLYNVYNKTIPSEKLTENQYNNFDEFLNSTLNGIKHHREKLDDSYKTRTIHVNTANVFSLEDLMD